MRIGLLTSDEISEFREHTLAPILNDENFKIEVALVDQRPEKGLKQKLIDSIKRGRGGYIIVMAFNRFFEKSEPSKDIVEFCDEHQIAVEETLKPYSKDVIAKIKSYDLDVLLLVDGFGIVKSKMLKAAKNGVLSYHHGNMRNYRGMPPAFWELYNNEKEMGVTVQILTPGLDCGTPIEEKTIEIKPKDVFTSLEARAYHESEGMLYEALKKLADPEFVPEQIESFGKVYTLPNLRQWINFQLKMLKRKLF